MKREEDIDFISLLQDEGFIKLVKDSLAFDDQIGFIEQYYPIERDTIVYAVDFINNASCNI